MTKLHLLLLSLLAAGHLAAQTTPPLGIIDKTPDLKAYTNARIHTSPTDVVDNGVLIVEKGQIVAVGATVTIPDGAVVIDLKGKTIYPGFIDPYTEYGLDIETPPRPKRHAPPVYANERVGCNAWNGAIHAEQNWVDHFEPDRKAAESFLKQGFTSVQSAHTDGVFQGRGFVTSLGQGLPNDLVIRPYTWHFFGFDKGSSRQDYPTSLMGCIALVRQTLLDAAWYRKAHAAYAKNPNQEKPEVNTALESLANIGNEKAIFRTDGTLNIFRADAIGKEFDLDVVPVGGRYAFERLDEIKKAGRTMVVTLDFPEAPRVGSLEDELDASLRDLRRWDWAPSNPALLEEQGIRFAFTSRGLKKKDTYLGNIRRAVKRGLSKTTALAAMTTVPADICGVADRVGSLAVGKQADFFVSDGDIFDDKTVIFAIFTQGRMKEFIPLDKTDFTGYYEGVIENQTIGLKVTDTGIGCKRDLSGMFRRGDVVIKLREVSAERDKVQFKVPLDSIGVEGYARFSLRKISDTLTGKVVFASGALEAWTAVAAAEPVREGETDSTKAVEKDTKKEAETEKPDRKISRVTYPNVAYGFETLPQQENVLVKNATVWSSEADGILENADLLIENGKIKAVGADLEAPRGFRVIDATGKHVAAGIIDEHSHICISGDVNEGTEAISSETRIGDVIRSDDIAVYRSLAGGTTVTRTCHGSANPIGGQQQVIKLRWGLAPEEMKADDECPPSLKFALGENVRQCNWGDQFRTRYPQSRMGVETIIKDAFQAAKEYGAEWEAYRALSRKDREKTIPPRRDLRWEALLEILNKERAIDCHSYRQAEILMLMRLAEEFGVKVTTFIHILEGYKIADEMVRHGAMGGSIPDWWAYKFEVYDAIPHGPSIMHEHGVVVSINSDSQHLQRLLNQAAAKSVQYGGMSQEDAWNMVTINPAKQLEAEEYIGSLKAGKDADFVIWNGNPLSIYSQVEQTWIEGVKYFDRDDDARMRREVVEEKNRLIQKILEKPLEKKGKYHDKKPPVYGPDQEGGSHE